MLPLADRSSDLLAAYTTLPGTAISLSSSNQLFHIAVVLPLPLPLLLPPSSAACSPRSRSRRCCCLPLPQRSLTAISTSHCNAQPSAAICPSAASSLLLPSSRCHLPFSLQPQRASLPAQCCQPLPQRSLAAISVPAPPLPLLPAAALPSPSPALCRSHTTLLPLSFPRCSGAGHTAAALHSSCPCFCLYYHPLPQLHDPSAAAAASVAAHATTIAPRDLAAPPVPPPSLPPLPLLHHCSSHPEAISLLNHCHFSSSLPPPLLPSPAPASLLPSRCCCSPQQGSTTPPEPSLPTHSSVAAASDRHILLKGHRLCCLAYHTAAFSSSSRTLLCRCLCPAALYLSFSFLLPSSPPAATTASFSPSAATTFMQPCPRQLGSLQPQPLPTPTLLLSSPCRASSSSTLAVVSIINAAASFAISAAPISTLPLPVTAALSHSRRRFAAFQR
ncbi:hypothetical protein B296_00037518 [Ensete ventricosum]|uniref:Uncharacterized protein n=1 Tax=Ensete ventricosum TaxID=4639 RepID=A0A426YK29_ENSVE|nr:hypothetical protein B296_00037518 [Ensete ventricosum]